jgi:anti-sigma regulatory factor (Ser/Thr protein kinase)
MPTATLTLPASPEQARTARLVAGVAARRAGVDVEAVDDIRLAVAEAMAQAAFRVQGNPTGMVRMELSDDVDSFEIVITDGQDIDVESEDQGLALSLIQALAPRARIVGAESGEALVLGWPANV